jgi:tetratricopeptide (TPR) repeat protein
MTREDAERLLALSREANWTFPSSAGNPLDARGRGEQWVERLLAEQQSVVDAARYFVDAGELDAATELAANTWRLWMVSRDIDGGRWFLATVLAAGNAKASRERALALYGDGLFGFWQGKHEHARERNEAALAAANASGDDEALALAHLGMSRVAVDDGDHERARTHAEQARKHARDLGAAMGQAPLHLHAQAVRQAGDYDEAAALFEQSLELNRRIGDEGMVGVELHNLGHVEIHRGNVDAAERYFAKCAEQETDDPYGAALTQFNEAAVAYLRNDSDRARSLFDEAQALLEESGIKLATDDRAEVDWLSEQLAKQNDG